MRRCFVCEGILEDSNFQNGDSVCRICRSRLRWEEDVRYAKPKRRTIRQAYTNLILAIKQQAIFDEALKDWEDFWLQTEPWPKIWGLLKSAVAQSELARDDLQKQIGGS